MKILIIEDEKLLADSIKVLLERKGFQVECAYDGKTGEEYAELGIYDLLVLDVMMPELNGYQVAQQVRAKRCSTPILMLTARSDLEDRIAGLNAGADYYLTKPFDTRELLACINALLRRQGGQVDELRYGNTALDLSTCILSCGEKSIPKKCFWCASGGLNPTPRKTMWRSMWAFCGKNCKASGPTCASWPSAGKVITWRWTPHAEKAAA